MKKTKIFCGSDFVMNPKLHKQKVEGVSATIPDESFTIREILEKFTRGVDPMLTKLGSGFEDSEIDIDDSTDFKFNDLTDIDEINEYLHDLENRKLDILKKKKESEELKKDSALPT